MPPIKTMRELLRDKEGATGILLGSSFMAIAAAGALAIDLGSLYLAERKLQGAADAAAMAAARGNIVLDGEEIARTVIEENGLKDVTIRYLTPGTYTQDKSLDYDQRFAETTVDPTAAQIELVQEVPLFFGKIISGNQTGTVRVRATAARMDMAAYSLGSKLAEFSGGLGNEVLSQLAGTNLALTVMDTQGLANANIDILNFADALKAGVGADGKTYGEVFDMDIPLHQAVEAMAAATNDAGVAALLTDIAAQLSNETIVISDIIELGPVGDSDVNDGNSGVSVDAYSLLRSFLELSQGDFYDIEFQTSAGGLATATIRIVGGSGMRSSPWLTITAAREYVIRTSQSRIYLTVSTGIGVTKVKIPIYVELAEAEARLSDIQCTGDPDTDGVTLLVTPSVGTLALAHVDADAFSDLTTELTLEPAVMAQVLTTKVTGFSEIDLGGASAQSVFFNEEEIRDLVTKTVSTNDLAQAIVTSLAEDVELKVETSSLVFDGSSLLSLVNGQLALIAPVLDQVLYRTTQSIGLKYGAADVRVDRSRCGVSTLAA